MADTKTSKNWIVRYYNKKDKLIGSAVIKDRTEHEAEDEAIAYMPYDCDDWTLTEAKELTDNVKADLEAQDYDLFGKNKV
jgi:hypothetical protein